MFSLPIVEQELVTLARAAHVTLHLVRHPVGSGPWPQAIRRDDSVIDVVSSIHPPAPEAYYWHRSVRHILADALRVHPPYTTNPGAWVADHAVWLATVAQLTPGQPELDPTIADDDDRDDVPGGWTPGHAQAWTLIRAPRDLQRILWPAAAAAATGDADPLAVFRLRAHEIFHMADADVEAAS